LNTVARDVAATLDLKRIMETALQEVIQLTDLSSGVIFLYDEKRSSVEMQINRGVSSRLVASIIELHESKSEYRASLLRGRIRQTPVDKLLGGGSE
jgi:GAF domain-containing protein